MNLLEYIETQAIGKLDIKENQVGLTVGFKPRHALRHIVDLAVDTEFPARGFQEADQFSPREGLIFYDQNIHTLY